ITILTRHRQHWTIFAQIFPWNMTFKENEIDQEYYYSNNTHLHLPIVLTFLHVAASLIMSSFESVSFSCDDFLVSMFGVYHCIFAALFIAQLALAFFHCILRPIPHRALAKSAHAVFGASAFLSSMAAVIIGMRISATSSATCSFPMVAFSLFLLFLSCASNIILCFKFYQRRI
ncbi:hypothetical protein PENTCL1PPCAC_15067, partial [Pristionchus entomophagus]